MREEGYYWTRSGGEWGVSWFRNGRWFFGDYNFGDEYFNEIDERRIVRWGNE